MSYTKLRCFGLEEKSDIAPLRVLSFDIECAGRKGVFPEPKHDPVIMIACYVTRQGEATPFIRNIFTVRGCSNIIGAEVFSFPTETEMLSAFRAFVVAADPDVLTGYNINNFDLPYLIHRAEALKLQSFLYLGRIKNVRSRVSTQKRRQLCVCLTLFAALRSARPPSPPRPTAHASRTKPPWTGNSRCSCLFFSLKSLCAQPRRVRCDADLAARLQTALVSCRLLCAVLSVFVNRLFSSQLRLERRVGAFSGGAKGLEREKREFFFVVDGAVCCCRRRCISASSAICTMARMTTGGAWPFTGVCSCVCVGFLSSFCVFSLQSEGRVSAAATAGQADVRGQLHRDGPRDGRSFFLSALSRPASQGECLLLSSCCCCC